MQTPVKELCEPVSSETKLSTTVDPGNTNTKPRESSGVSRSSNIPSALVKRGDSEENNTFAKGYQSNTQELLGLSHVEESVSFLTRSDGSRLQSSYGLNPASIAGLRPESPLERQLNSVRMKVNLAEMIVRNATGEPKVLVSPEKRRKEMVQLEVAKLILFLARQFNIREDLQNVMGRALEVSEAFTTYGPSTGSEIPFFARESSPDLSIKELRCITAEMEERLRQEMEKRGNRPPPVPISADRATSNLSEILWLIESLELEMPTSQYADLDNEFKSQSFILTTTANASVTNTAVTKTLRHELPKLLPVQQADLRKQSEAQCSLQLTTVASNLSGHLSKVDSLPLGATAPNITLQKSSTSSDDVVLSTDERESCGEFSVDEDSTVAGALEAADLKLLQFMYDAINSDSLEARKREKTDLGAGSEHQMQEGVLRASEDGLYSSVKRTDSSRPRGLTAGAADTSWRGFSAWNRSVSGAFSDSNEEFDDMETDDVVTAKSHSSLSTVSAPCSEPPLVVSWARPTQPAVRVYPLRKNLFETLQELYSTFNYNYHFQHSKSKGTEIRRKSLKDYSNEMERRLAREKSEKQRKRASIENDGDELLLWTEVGLSPQRTESRERSRSLRREISQSGTEKSTPQAGSEASPLEQSLLDDIVPVEAAKNHDDTILLSEEVGTGLLFVLKGRRENSLSSTGSASGRQSDNGLKPAERGNSMDGKMGNGKATKGNVNKIDGSISKKGKAHFDSYILYALNQSKEPQRALVHIDSSKLQNLKLRALIEYVVKKETIAVELPPQGAKSVLLLKPVKKKKQVMFGGALRFSQETSLNEVPDAKYKGSIKALGSQMSATRSGHRGADNTLGSTQRIDSVLAAQAISPDISERDEGIFTKDEPREDTDAEHEVVADTVEANEVSLQMAVVTDTSEHRMHETEQESDMDKEMASLLDRTIGKKDHMQKERFKMQMFGNTSGGEEAFGEEEEIKDSDTTALSRPIAAPKVSDEDDTTSLSVDGRLKEQEGLLRQKRKKSTLPRSAEESGKKLGEGESALLGEVMVRKGSNMKTGDDSLLEAEGTFVQLTPVDKWGLSLGGDEEAFEKNCVILSVLQASEWQPNLIPQEPFSIADSYALDSADHTQEEGVKREKLGNTSGIFVLDDVPQEYLPSTLNKRLSAQFREEKAGEDMVSAILNRAEGGEELSPEEMVANVLNRIADEEQLGGEDILDDNIMPPQTRKEGSARVGSISLSQHYLPSKEQQSQLNFAPEDAPVNRHLPLKRSFEVPSLTGSTTTINKTRSSIHSAILQKGTVKRREGSVEADSSFNLASAESLLRPQDHAGASAPEFLHPIMEMKRQSPDKIPIDSCQHSHVETGDSDTQAYFCEDCACELYPDYPLIETNSDEKVAGDAQYTAALKSPSLLDQKEDVRSETAASVALAFKTPEVVSQAALPSTPSPLNLDLLLAGVTKATKQMPPPETKRRKKGRFLPNIPQQKPISPTRHHAYTEKRPGGRLAVFAPEEADTAGPASSGKKKDTEKASISFSAAVERAEMFAEEIRTSLHACARQAMVNSNYSPAEPNARKYQSNRAVVRKKTPHDVQHATLPPLSILYPNETGQEVENMEVAEEEARDLFMLDPARYDCVVDDLVKLATKRVYEEEERDKTLASLSRRRTVKAADGSITDRNKLRLTRLSSRRSSVATLRISMFSQSRSAESALSEKHDGMEESRTMLHTEKSRTDTTQVIIASGLDQLLEEQCRAKKIVAFILMEMRRMWQRREMEANRALRAAVDRFIYRSLLFSWHFERRRVLNLRKLIFLLDRKTGRVGGWVPFFTKDRVVEDRFLWEPAPPHLSRPLRVVHRAMCLARRQRLFPLRLVRLQAHQRGASTPYLLYGYKRTLLEPYTTTAVRLRSERRCRYAAPFQRSIATFSPQVEWRDGMPER